MEERFLKATTIIVGFLTIVTCFFLIYFPDLHTRALRFADSRLTLSGSRSVLSTLKASEDAMDAEAPQLVEDEMRGHQIRLVLPQNVKSDGISLQSDYLNKSVTITIEGVGKDYFDKYPIKGSCDNIADVVYTSENLVGSLELFFDDVKEVSMLRQGENVYLDLVDPHDIYDYVVVVDAGHGGNVPGAYKKGICEKDIDLDIVLALKNYFDKTNKNIGVYYTRTMDCNPSFASRVALPNDSEADLYISIHNNSTASGRMSSISGTEVMYRGADATGESKRFAQLCLDKLLASLGSKNKGTVVGDEIFIIRESKAPVALIEVGFMTNEKELKLLCDSDYQDKAAKAIYEAVIEYLYTAKEIKDEN